jgi:UDP-N-acetylmuramyl-tripeptide synthetase
MAAYARAKTRLFEWPGLTGAVVNADDAFGTEIHSLLVSRNVPVLGYGLNAGDVRALDYAATPLGLRLLVATPRGQVNIASPLIGRFNAYNLLCALGILLSIEVPPADAAAALSGVAPPPGRMQRFGGGDAPVVVVDYAHTHDALEKVLTALRELRPRRLICVFGCGGNRDKGKRPLMGKVAARLADEIWLTSDNPRNEDPEQIIADIAEGLGDVRYRVEPDRAAAIAGAVRDALPGDVVLVAGKGHENTQEVAGVKLPFLDAAVVTAALENRAAP